LRCRSRGRGDGDSRRSFRVVVSWPTLHSRRGRKRIWCWRLGFRGIERIINRSQDAFLVQPPSVWTLITSCCRASAPADRH
jgi:hypothetical protein